MTVTFLSFTKSDFARFIEQALSIGYSLAEVRGACVGVLVVNHGYTRSNAVSFIRSVV